MTYLRNPYNPLMWESDGNYNGKFQADDGTFHDSANDAVKHTEQMRQPPVAPGEQPPQAKKEEIMKSADLMQTTDHVIWAREFVQRYGGDEELMASWFASAMMAMHDKMHGPPNGDAMQYKLDQQPPPAPTERILPDGVPCGHAGCLNHISHPCEGCGRIAGRMPPSQERASDEPLNELAREIADVYWPIGTTTKQDALFDSQLDAIKPILRDALATAAKEAASRAKEESVTLYKRACNICEKIFARGDFHKYTAHQRIAHAITRHASRHNWKVWRKAVTAPQPAGKPKEEEC